MTRRSLKRWLPALFLCGCNAVFAVDDLRYTSGDDGSGGAGGGDGGGGDGGGVEPSCIDGIQNGDETGVDCGGSCEPCKPGAGELGAPCASDDDCDSGHCPPQDGVCCDTACALTCEACVADKTGEADGFCDFVDPVIDPDPDGECPGSPVSECGFDQRGCHGELTSCHYWPAGSQCQAAGCANGEAVEASFCDGGGTCVAGATDNCFPYVCGGGVSCLTSCSQQDDCVSSRYCDDGACVPKKGAGSPCSADHECDSNNCAGTVCA